MRGGRGEDSGAVFGCEAGEYLLIGGAGGDGCAELVAHVAGFGTADVVAFAEELRATAGAHEAMAQVVEAGAGIRGGGGEADGYG